MEIPAKYPYNRKWWVLIVGAFFFLFCSCVFFYFARHPQDGPALISIFGDRAAGALFMSCSVISAAFVAVFLFLGLRRILVDDVLQMGPQGLDLPQGLLKRRSVGIPYSAMSHLREVTTSGQAFLHFTALGKKFH